MHGGQLKKDLHIFFTSVNKYWIFQMVKADWSKMEETENYSNFFEISKLEVK